MKQGMLVLFLVLLIAPAARAAAVTPMLLLNGGTQYPCNGQEQVVASPAVNSNVIGSYIFVVSNAPVVDVAVVPEGNPTFGTIADMHKLAIHGFSPGGYASPTWTAGYANMWSGDARRSFEPDSVAVTNAQVYAECSSPGTWMSIYLEVETRPTP